MDDVFCCEFSHDEREFAIGRHYDGSAIKPPHVLLAATARFTLTRNLMFLIVGAFSPKRNFRIALDRRRQPGTTPFAPPRFYGVLPFHLWNPLALGVLYADSYVLPCRAAFAGAAVLSGVC